jgi:hypothetical protein
VRTPSKHRQRSERNDWDALYLRAVKRLEALPQNQSGAYKTWVERAMRSWQEHYTRATR